jgi:hypothetical protein
VAENTAKELQREFSYQLSVEFIDGNPELEKEYGEKVPVIMINGQPHDYWRIDRARFIAAVSN